jgi:hypothetical protein
MQVVRMRRLVRGRNLTTYTIDLRTRVVPETLRIWRLFPGKDYIFLPDFQEQSVVFLDFPGLPLPDGPVSESLSDLAERIMVSNAVSEWARRRERADPSDRESRASPSRDPADYVNERRPRNLTIDKGAIAGFFGRPAKGDLVVVPGPIRSRHVLVGEFLHGPERRTTAESPKYGNVSIPARSVRWFPAVNELELPPRVSEVIRRPNPFVSFDLRLYTEIFDRTLGTYVHGDGYAARFDTKSAKFTGDDNLDFIILAESVARIVQEIDGGGDISRYSHLLDLAISQRDTEYKFDLSMNINSPGSILSKSGTLIVLVFAALLPLLQIANADEGIPSVKVINTGSGLEHDPCTPQVDAQVQKALEFMQIQVWREACERSVRLRQNPQMQGAATAKPDSAQLPTPASAR